MTFDRGGTACSHRKYHRPVGQKRLFGSHPRVLSPGDRTGYRQLNSRFPVVADPGGAGVTRLAEVDPGLARGAYLHRL